MESKEDIKRQVEEESITVGSHFAAYSAVLA